MFNAIIPGLCCHLLTDMLLIFSLHSDFYLWNIKHLGLRKHYDKWHLLKLLYNVIKSRIILRPWSPILGHCNGNILILILTFCVYGLETAPQYWSSVAVVVATESFITLSCTSWLYAVTVVFILQLMGRQWLMPITVSSSMWAECDMRLTKRHWKKFQQPGCPDWQKISPTMTQCWTNTSLTDIQASSLRFSTIIELDNSTIQQMSAGLFLRKSSSFGVWIPIRWSRAAGWHTLGIGTPRRC